MERKARNDQSSRLSEVSFTHHARNYDALDHVPLETQMTSKAVTALRALLFLIACPVILIFTGPLTRMVSPEAGPLLVGSIAGALTFALTLLFVRWDGLRLRDVGAAFTARTAPRLAFGCVVGIALVALQDLVIYSGGHAHWVRDASRPFSLGLLALAGYAALALREELAFRGYPLRRLESTWGMWPALILMTAAFTFEHAAGGWTWSRALLGPPVGALLFGIAALRTRGLAVPLGIHAAFNFAQWFMGQKETAGPFKLLVDPGFSDRADMLGYAAYLTATLIAAAAFWLWHTRRAHR